MTASGRVGQSMLYAAVAALAVGWMVGATVAIGGFPDDPPPDARYYRDFLLASAFLAVPWLVAARLLWRAWWAGAGARLSTMDPPERLLAVAVAALPERRRDWGVAMTAELAQVRDRRERWWFAVGSARTALFPPDGSRVRVLSVALPAVAAVIVAGVVVGAAVPAMRAFAVTFVGLVGAMAVVAAAGARRIRPAVTGPALVAACIAATGYFLIQYPTAAGRLQPTLLFLAAVLAGALWLALSPPRALTSHRLARRIAAGVALALAAGLVLTLRLNLHDDGIFGYLFALPVPVLFAASAITAAVSRSFRAGVQAAVWAAVLTSLACYAVAMLEAVRWFRLDSSLILAADTVPAGAVGANLRNFTWGLVLFPFWWLPFGILGAALAATAWRVRRRGTRRR